MTHCTCAARAAQSVDWTTPAEAAHYRTTPTYDETMHYVRRLADASPWIRVTTYGTSPQGRPLPLVIVSKRGAFTPARARATGEPIVLIQNGIHSGEIEGKDATLALLRDICITKTRAALIDHATLLILPIFSVDAHERRSRYNRINQNGPEEMGWRSTSQGLNLNRDYLKTETPEMRALIGNVFTKWWPHILVDNHTTDGADYQHDLTYSFNHGPDTPRAVEQWCVDAFEGRVIPRCGEMGHLTAPYLTFRGNGPQTGIDFTSSSPRFSTGYAAIQCRPGILVETHMLKPYESRVRATYDLMVSLLEEIGAHPRALTQAVQDAEAEVVARGRELGSVVLATRASDVSVPFAYRGRQAQMVQSDIAGGPVPHYSDAPWDTTIPLYRDALATVTVQQPAGYIVPREWTIARDWLAMHGVRFTPLARAWTDSVEMSRILTWDVAPRGSEGHRPITARDVRLERQKRTFRAGDLWVPLDQPRGLVAVHICEARAPDGLLYWNAFNTILETKEYGEDYVVEPLARKMLAENPALASEFAAKVASDSVFAHDPGARLDWFYRRSPWADADQNLLPIAGALHAPPANALITRRRR